MTFRIKALLIWLVVSIMLASMHHTRGLNVSQAYDPDYWPEGDRVDYITLMNLWDQIEDKGLAVVTDCQQHPHLGNQATYFETIVETDTDKLIIIHGNCGQI